MEEQLTPGQINYRKYKTLVVKGRHYIEIPNFVCSKCFSLINMAIKHDPDELEIKDCECYKPK